MMAKGISQEFAERVFQQICGFGEYGFPESHAASFALIAYATSWLKWHHPVIFTCGLLNAQPMGFYSVATIVRDAQRHGVEIRGICIAHSAWDCTMEKVDSCSKSKSDGYALRVGLRFVKELGERDAERLIAARRIRPFSDLEDALRRGGLGHTAQVALAEAGAFSSFGSDRRDDLWFVYSNRAGGGDTLRMPSRNTQKVELSELSPLEEVVWDLQRSGHSAAGHPMQAFRALLRKTNYVSSAELHLVRDGARAHCAGIVICRQRPGTSKGVTFMTLEDELGFINVVIWQSIFERYRQVAKGVALVAIAGTVQNQEGVVHLVAERLWDPEFAVEGGAVGTSRDFR